MRAYVGWQNTLLDHQSMARDRFVESPLAHPSAAARRAVLEGLGRWRDFDGPEDYDLWLRAFDAGLRFGKLDAVLLDWHDSPRRLTRTDPRYAPGRFLALKLEALARGPLAGSRAAAPRRSRPERGAGAHPCGGRPPRARGGSRSRRRRVVCRRSPSRGRSRSL